MQASTRVTSRNVSAPSGAMVMILSFSGDIASTSKDAIMEAYSAIPDCTKSILLDFSGSEYVNSSGIAIVIQLLLDASKKDRKVGLTGLRPHFVKVFTMVGVAKYATISPDQGSALDAL